MKSLRNIIQEKLIINKETKSSNSINEIILTLFNDIENNDTLYDNSSDFDFGSEIHKIIVDEYSYLKYDKRIKIFKIITDKLAYIPSTFPNDKFEKVLIKNEAIFSNHKNDLKNLYTELTKNTNKGWTTIRKKYAFSDEAVVSMSEDYLVMFFWDSQNNICLNFILVKFV